MGERHGWYEPQEEVLGRLVCCKTERGEDILDKVEPEQLHNGEDSAADQLSQDSEGASGDVNRELELLEIELVMWSNEVALRSESWSRDDLPG